MLPPRRWAHIGCMTTQTDTALRCPAAAPDPESAIKDFIADRAFPCVGAKSALNKDRLETAAFGALGTEQTTQALHAQLRAYAARHPDPGLQPVSFIATFSDAATDEKTFEARLWQQLQALHALDAEHDLPWDPTVSDDPTRADFSFSVGGRAFFVVGLHPGASRLARRSPVTCLVFNFHEQFEALKASGKYVKMQEAIRERDMALQGSINPVLARFGESSEARQYSGRAVESDWKCPFHAEVNAHA